MNTELRKIQVKAVETSRISQCFPGKTEENYEISELVFSRVSIGMQSNMQ
jgi:hypothetical protein